MNIVSRVLLCSLVATATTLGAELTVSTDFSGGSAEISKLDSVNRTVRFNPARHKDRGWACWWYFRLSGIKPGETITLDVGDAPWATPGRAAFSTDNKTWAHTSPGKRDGKRIVYRQVVKASEAWFAWGPPFVPSDAQALVDNMAKKSPHVKAVSLCKTRGGLNTPAALIEQPGAGTARRYGVWIQARQHAWESGSSWVAKGLLDWLLSKDAEELRKTARIVVIPIMDIDNVHQGAGGKQQKPQDHNRDWTVEPHWRAVAAAQAQIKELDEVGKFDLFIDLHNPGAGDRHPFYFVPPDDLLSRKGKQNLERFVAASKRHITGPLAYRGTIKASGKKYDKAWRAISKNWVAANCRDQVVAVTLETPWNTPGSTTKGYETVGRQLGAAIANYLHDRRVESSEK